jgi:uncharacterized protein (TIGR00269 family)
LPSTLCKCGKEAFYFRRQSGEALCRRCFARSIERTVHRTVKREKLFTPDDRVMIALSGGKDSVALAHILSKIEKPYRTKLFALTIDEGVSGYREEGISITRGVAEALGMEHHIVTFKEEYGHSLEEVYALSGERGTGLLGCTFCGIMRRRLLNDMAIRLGATKVATGHNLDDEAQTFLINILRGDVARLGRAGVQPVKVREGFVPRVKPLRYIPEKEITAYVYMKGYPLYERECPYVRDSVRDEIRDILNGIEERHPGTKHAIVNGSDKLMEALKPSTEAATVGTCSRCGSPSSRGVCRMCEVLDMLGLGSNTFINHLAE